MKRFLLFSLAVLLPAAAAAQARPSAQAIEWLCKGAPFCDRVVAVVDSEPVLLSEVVGEAQLQLTRRNMRMPPDSASQYKMLREIIEAIIDAKVLVNAAKLAEIEVNETEIMAKTDAQMQSVRRQFPNDSVMREALREAGFPTVEAFRQVTLQQYKDSVLQTEYVQKMRSEGKMPAPQVSEAEILEEYNAIKGQLPPNLGGYAFRQIVIPVRPSPANKLAAHARADSLRNLVMAGADFAETAKKESMDSSTRESGGLIPMRRKGLNPDGSRLVAEFERWIFQLPLNVISPVFETQYGYHFVRVERRDGPANVESRHILIKPTTDSNDVAATRVLADSVATALRGGASFDTLANRYHTNPDEVKSFPSPIPLDAMLVEYATAMKDLKAGEVSAPFQVVDRAGDLTFRIVIVTKIAEPRENTIDDWRALAKDRITGRKQMRKFIDALRKKTYVSIQL